MWVKDTYVLETIFSFNLKVVHYQLMLLNSTFISVKQEASPPRKRVLRSKEYKNSITLTEIQKDILIGTLLGDSSLEFGAKRSINARLRFDQTFPAHASYLMFIYSHFYELGGSGPKVYIRKPDPRTGKIYSSIQFKTLALPCLNYYRDLFYNEKGKKIIPDNIGELLTARALAFCICDDGNKSFYNQTSIYTQAYSYDDVLLLKNALKVKFKLKTRLNEIKFGQWAIVIPVKQEISLKQIVLPYMHYSMLYKV